MIALPHETLCGYNGTYRLTPDITTKVTCTDAGLKSERTGRKAVEMKAEVRYVFFTPGHRGRGASFCAMRRGRSAGSRTGGRGWIPGG